MQTSVILGTQAGFSAFYPVPSLPVSVFIVPLCQRDGEPMMLPLIRDAVGWEQLLEDWSVVGGKEGCFGICTRRRGFWMTVKKSFSFLGGMTSSLVQLSSI